TLIRHAELRLRHAEPRPSTRERNRNQPITTCTRRPYPRRPKTPHHPTPSPNPTDTEATNSDRPTTGRSRKVAPEEPHPLDLAALGNLNWTVVQELEPHSGSREHAVRQVSLPKVKILQT